MNRTDQDRNRWLRAFAALIGASTIACAQESMVTLRVTNPSKIDRPQEPILVAWSTIAKALPGLTSTSVTVADEKGRFVMNQVDDLDADGTPDELVFTADLGSGQTRTFVVKPGPVPTNLPVPPVRTDAGNWKKTPAENISVDDDDGPGLMRDQGSYRYDGIGWESEVTGYRLYLDERNALDIQGKRVPGLYWNYIGSSAVDYQADANWGMDVLHVGPALGAGGFAFWNSDSVVKPLDLERRRTRVIARGPVRVVIRVEYRGWKVGRERLNAVSTYVMYAGERLTEHRLTLLNGGPRTVAVGIVKHAASKVTWDPGLGVLLSDGKQSRSNERLMMAVHVQPKAVQRVTADAWNDLVLLRVSEGEPLRYLVSNWWEGEWHRSGGSIGLGDVSSLALERLGRAPTVELAN